MIHQLSIKDFLIIKNVDVDLQAGFSAITGETGAGKSILLQALELLLGAKVTSAVVRPGAKQAVLSCSVSCKPDHILALQELGIEADEKAFIRRVIDQDNKSKFFVNDTLVTSSLIRQTFARSITIHNQFDDLMSVENQRKSLDTFAKLEKPLAQLQGTYLQWQSVLSGVQDIQDKMKAFEEQRDYLLFALAELDALSPEEDEESKLLEQRQVVGNRQKIVTHFSALSEALVGERGIYDLIHTMQAHNQKLSALVNEDTSELAQHLDALQPHLVAVEQYMLRMQSRYANTSESLEGIDDRLHQLRNAARKYRCTADQLSQKRHEFQDKVNSLTEGALSLDSLQQKAQQLQEAYSEQAQSISSIRHTTARALADKLAQELPAMKLDKVGFRIDFRTRDITEASVYGLDDIVFQVQMNPGLPFANLSNTASGGELSRFMLALRSVLSDVSHEDTLIFDEIDAGTGGAVAHAIGQKLRTLSQKRQVLCITHAPQVAAEADDHFVIEKSHLGEETSTTLRKLDASERIDEVARMLSGQVITDVSRQAAQDLLRRLA